MVTEDHTVPGRKLYILGCKGRTKELAQLLCVTLYKKKIPSYSSVLQERELGSKLVPAGPSPRNVMLPLHSLQGRSPVGGTPGSNGELDGGASLLTQAVLLGSKNWDGLNSSGVAQPDGPWCLVAADAWQRF